MNVLEPTIKAGVYAALFLAVGAAGVRLLWHRADGTTNALGGRAKSFALTASVILLIFLWLRLLAHTAAAFGVAELSWDSLKVMALESRWSYGWRLQVAAAVACVVGARWLGRFPIALVAALIAMALALPFSGHAAGSASTRLVATAHLLGGGAWMGTLAALVLTRQHGAIWSRFSLVAMVGAAVVSTSGVLLATTYLGTWRDLVDTPYGMVLVGKMVLLLGIAGCGFLNWRLLQRSIPLPGGPRYAALETVLALCLLIVTAFLTEIAHP